MNMRTIALLPLDDRPVNTDDVALVTAAAGGRLALPDRALLPPRGEPGDIERLHSWLLGAAADADACVVSINQLLYGGYVASRRTTEPLGTVLPRLETLRELRRVRPQRPIHAAVTLMRTKEIDGAGAEPAYWEHHGARLFRLSEEIFRREHGRVSAVEEAARQIPAEHVADFMLRRTRLHAMHLACLELVAEGVLDTLWILVEDSTPESLSTSEREWLTSWIDRLGLADRVQCLPGADEAGSVLTVRSLLQLHHRRPRIAVVSAVPRGLDRVAPYEDVPVGETVSRQLRMLGAEPAATPGEADLVLAVHPPAETPRDWCRRPEGEPARTDETARALARLVRELVEEVPVTVADVADANGADPGLVTSLRDAGLLERLAGYAGWNTAGNSIGTALAQGSAALLGTTEPARQARARLLTRRLVDDWAYQVHARPDVVSDPAAPATAVETELVARLGELGPPTDRFRIAPGSVRHPWDRSFEISFELIDTGEGLRP
jgi:hypothetical protein